MKALHYTDVAERIRDFVYNKNLKTLTLYVEKWNEDDECSMARVEITKGEGVSISATFYNGDDVIGIPAWEMKDTQCRHMVTYDRVYNFVANALSEQFNWFFAEKEHKGLHAARGDHNTGWYQIGDRCANMHHSDWCVFDEDGNIGCNELGRPICWTTKKVAQDFAENPGSMFYKWGNPIASPFKFENR